MKIIDWFFTVRRSHRWTKWDLAPREEPMLFGKVITFHQRRRCIDCDVVQERSINLWEAVPGCTAPSERAPEV